MCDADILGNHQPELGIALGYLSRHSTGRSIELSEMGISIHSASDNHGNTP